MPLGQLATDIRDERSHVEDSLAAIPKVLTEAERQKAEDVFGVGTVVMLASLRGITRRRSVPSAGADVLTNERVELRDGPDETERPFLDQIEERKAPAGRLRGAHDHLLPHLPDRRQAARGPAAVPSAPVTPEVYGRM